jgi:hypothetical protein
MAMSVGISTMGAESHHNKQCTRRELGDSAIDSHNRTHVEARVAVMCR